ncbi:hypothetical protein CPC08DRAFT_762703 [Agrocybe pediades]|nr:hypothetical protein CPC08DRAFT_762703 [Agrocybe pediades]
MASDSSDSPMLLTPESTGTPSGLTIDTNLPDSPTTSTSSSASNTLKKARRQTAFYPNMNSSNKQQKPFSRSAAKRESVMALGSIEHLQHYFTKTGLAAKKNPLDKPHHGLVPAIGGLGHIPTSPSLSDIIDFQMPPSPAVPNTPKPVFSPHVKTYDVDPESLLPGVIDDLTAAAIAWQLERYPDETAATQPNLDVHFDVLEVLKTTTRAIRSTRNYLLSLPDESAGTIRAQFRPAILGPGKSTSSSSIATSSSTSSVGSNGQPDPLILIRRAALEVLHVLRQLEENCRLPLEDEAYDAQSDGEHSHAAGGVASSPSNGAVDLPSSDGAPAGSEADASITFSLVQVQGRYESVPVWEDEEDVFGVEEEEEKQKRDGWDERLVLGTGWLYKQDIKLCNLDKERRVVGSYLDIVDEVLFEGKRVSGEERGWDKVKRKREGRAVSRATRRRVSTGDTERKVSTLLDTDGNGGRRRVSTGMVSLMSGLAISEEPDNMDGIKEEEEEDEEVDDDDLPEWAKRSLFADDMRARAHALLTSFLPAHLQSALGDASSRSEFLSSLSSGQLLCIAYNACVRKSKKPWGFVSKDGVHDIIALEKAAKEQSSDEKEGNKKLWTFRRTDNLRLWIGALKLRYMLPIQIPTQPIANPPGSSTSRTNTPAGTPLSSPSKQRFPLGLGRPDREPPILFDARVVAKKEDGWEEMLEAVLYRWVEKAVEERRSSQ